MAITHKFWRSAALCLFDVIGLALVTLICFRLRFGLATTSLLYLIVVVLLSLKGSFISSAVASVLAVGCLDYFFTAPLFTFGKNDLPNVVAITVFLITSLVMTRLVSRVRKQAEEALSSASWRVIEAEEQECQRIAKDLHEDIGQRLTLLALEIEHPTEDSSNRTVDASRMDTVRKKILQILTDVKALAHELYSPRLEYLDIAGVMKSFCRDLGERKKVEIDFNSDGLPRNVPADLSLCLFRVLQEALHNAVKHSGVRQFDGRLWTTPDEIHLTVSDRGRGFNLGTARKAGGLGINRMHERLKLVKGSLSIDSQPNRGTTIQACIPLTSEGAVEVR